MNPTGIVLYIKNFSKINGFVPKKNILSGQKRQFYLLSPLSSVRIRLHIKNDFTLLYFKKIALNL